MRYAICYNNALDIIYKYNLEISYLMVKFHGTESTIFYNIIDQSNTRWGKLKSHNKNC